MARPRLPKNVHLLKGTDKKDPKRLRERENEPENVNPLGDAPKHLTLKERECWTEITTFAIPGVLGEADRLAVEMASILLCKCRGWKKKKNERGKMVVDRPGPQDQTQLYRYLGQFGMMPADRAKISIPKPKAKNKFDDD